MCSECFSAHVQAESNHASEEAFDRKRYDIKEKSLITKIEADLKQKMILQNSETAVEKDLRHVRENILTLKCPKCFHTYSTSFDRCLTLLCPSCSQSFCATCRLNKSPAGLFHNATTIRNIQNEMRKQKLQYFLAGKPHKKDLLSALRKSFLNLGLKHTNF